MLYKFLIFLLQLRRTRIRFSLAESLTVPKLVPGTNSLYLRIYYWNSNFILVSTWRALSMNLLISLAYVDQS